MWRIAVTNQCYEVVIKSSSIKMLEEKIRRLSDSVSEFAKLTPGFGEIIHKPGFTSIAEFALIIAGVDNLTAQMRTATDY